MPTKYNFVAALFDSNPSTKSGWRIFISPSHIPLASNVVPIYYRLSADGRITPHKPPGEVEFELVLEARNLRISSENKGIPICDPEKKLRKVIGNLLCNWQIAAELIPNNSRLFESPESTENLWCPHLFEPAQISTTIIGQKPLSNSPVSDEVNSFLSTSDWITLKQSNHPDLQESILDAFSGTTLGILAEKIVFLSTIGAPIPRNYIEMFLSTKVEIPKKSDG